MSRVWEADTMPGEYRKHFPKSCLVNEKWRLQGTPSPLSAKVNTGPCFT